MLKMISFFVVLLEAVLTLRSKCGVSLPPEHFTSEKKPSFLSSFWENNNVVVFPFPSHIFMSLANLWLICLKGQFPIPRKRSCPDLYPLIRPPKRPLTLARARILISGFVRSPATLAVYDVAHSLPRVVLSRGIPFNEDETRRHTSYLSCHDVCSG